MSGVKEALLLGGFPVIVGVLYFVLAYLNGGEEVFDPAGAVLLAALGVSMGFGVIVILRGARDI